MSVKFVFKYISDFKFLLYIIYTLFKTTNFLDWIHIFIEFIFFSWFTVDIINNIYMRDGFFWIYEDLREKIWMDFDRDTEKKLGL